MKRSNFLVVSILTAGSLGLATAGYAAEHDYECFGLDRNGIMDRHGGEICMEVTRPPRLDNGWGNGDQDAPGNSLTNNNAENYNGDNTDGTEGGTVTNSGGN